MQSHKDCPPPSSFAYSAPNPTRAWIWIPLGFVMTALGFLVAVAVSSWMEESKPSQPSQPSQSSQAAPRISPDAGPKSARRAKAAAPRRGKDTTTKSASRASKKDQRLEKKPDRHWIRNHMQDGKIPERKVAKLLAEVGFPAHAIPKMVCTARFESAFDSRATNENRNGSRDLGLFQINKIWHEPCGLTEKQLLDPVLNAQCAKKVFDESGYWAWYGYRKNQVTCRRYEVQMGPNQKPKQRNLAQR